MNPSVRIKIHVYSADPSPEAGPDVVGVGWVLEHDAHVAGAAGQNGVEPLQPLRGGKLAEHLCGPMDVGRGHLARCRLLRLVGRRRLEQLLRRLLLCVDVEGDRVS